MTNFSISISATMIATSIASKGLSKDDKVIMNTILSFAEYIRRLYLKLIEEDMNSNRYRGNWEPSEDKGYQEYLGVIPKYNILELLDNSLEIKKIGYTIYVRINPYMKYPGSRRSFLDVLRAIEYGTSDFPARPILAKNAREIQKNVLRLWKGFLMMKGVT